MKEVEYFPMEWAYNCPSCGHTHGWTNFLEDAEDMGTYEETHNCPKCNTEFKVKKPLGKID